MSLFQAREWWATGQDGNEETSYGNMTVCNIDNDSSGDDKIVTASFAGVLRVYYPKQRGYKIDDLMLEKHLEEPILQIASGRFMASVKGLTLAILHPRRLAVYQVSTSKGQGAMEAGYCSLIKGYERKLGRTAYNFCYGPFGQVQGKDFICVQSMDGQLEFLEQENFAFQRYLSNFLVPGPICYVAKIDSFLVATAAMEVDCYKYHTLNASEGSASREAKDEQTKHAKKLQADWSLNLGEHMNEIFVARFSKSLPPGQEDIIVLGEQSLFAITFSGTVRLMKHLDYNPSCARAFDAGLDGSGAPTHHLLVGTHQNSLMVYKEMQLLWAARAGAVPVSLAVGTFGGIKGFVVSLSDTCQLSVSYMGTDPPIAGVSAANNKELDYSAMDKEHRRLLKIIKQANSDKIVEPQHALVLRAQVPRELSSDVDHEAVEDEASCAQDEQGRFVSVVVKLFVSFQGNEDLTDISISFSHSPAFITTQSTIRLATLIGGNRTPTALNVRFRVSKVLVPSSLDVTAVATLLMPRGEPRTAKTTFTLPLCLAGRVISPLNNKNFMLTLDTNRDPPQMSDIFRDILEPVWQTVPNIQATSGSMLTLLYYSGPDVTILVSKNAGRYRLQSGHFEALSLLSQELKVRLAAFYNQQANQQATDFVMTFKELLPLADYFAALDMHHAVRLQLADLSERLEKNATQYRVIQKRLLAHFADKNPSPLQNLDVLLNDTYDALIAGGSEVQRVQQQLLQSANQLACDTTLMVFLIRCKYELDEENSALLMSMFSPGHADLLEQGWEENVNASMMYLLRTTLAKSVKDSANVAQALTFARDTTKLKRHIQIVCDRLGKGLRLIST